MPSLSMTLTEYSDNGNSRTYSLLGHTVNSTNLLIQKRKVPTGSQTTFGNTFTLVRSAHDSNGDLLPENVNFTITQSGPRLGVASERTAAVAALRDLVNSDEFAAAVENQGFLA